MNTITKLIVLFVLCVSFSIATQNIARAQITEAKQTPISKESFLAAWEAYQKSLSTTVTLEKTNESGVYNYETTLFPYSGKLKVHNVVISKDIDYYGNYDLDLDNKLKGVAEIELLDHTEKKNCNLFQYSKSIWRDQNMLFFNKNSKKWLSAEQWRETNNSNESQTCASQSSSALYQLFIDLSPLIFAALFLIFMVLLAQRGQKSQIAKYDLSMKRQKESIEKQNETLELMKEQNKLLRHLAENKE